MTDGERLALIQRVLQKAFDETNSFHDDQIGSSLAYLCLAIADGKSDGYVDWSDDAASEEVEAIRTLFGSWFVPEDPVWKFIQL